MPNDTTITCPRCERSAPWTDGIPADEPGGPQVWCQTCGHEFAHPHPDTA